MSHLIALVCFTIIAYLAGKYDERLKWNRLIQKGILPKPRPRSHV